MNSENNNNEIMNEAIQYLFDIKSNMKENHYIELMDILKKLFFKHDYKYEYVVDLQLTTKIAWIDNCGTYDKQKEEIFYDENTYKDSAEEINEDYEKCHEIVSDTQFTVVSNKEFTSDQDLECFVKNCLHKSPMIDSEVMERHQREVQEYYDKYIRYYDNWVRIVNDKDFITFIDIDYIGIYYT